jgi:hypothetical protein
MQAVAVLVLGIGDAVAGDEACETGDEGRNFIFDGSDSTA